MYSKAIELKNALRKKICYNVRLRLGEEGVTQCARFRLRTILMYVSPFCEDYYHCICWQVPLLTLSYRYSRQY